MTSFPLLRPVATSRILESIKPDVQLVPSSDRQVDVKQNTTLRHDAKDADQNATGSTYDLKSNLQLLTRYWMAESAPSTQAHISRESWGRYLRFKEDTCRKIFDEDYMAELQLNSTESGYFHWEANEFHRQLRDRLLPQAQGGSFRALIGSHLLSRLDPRLFASEPRSFCEAKRHVSEADERHKLAKEEQHIVLPPDMFAPRRPPPLMPPSNTTNNVINRFTKSYISFTLNFYVVCLVIVYCHLRELFVFILPFHHVQEFHGFGFVFTLIHDFSVKILKMRDGSVDGRGHYLDQECEEGKISDGSVEGTFDRSKFTDSAPNDDVKQLDLEKVDAYDAAHLEGRIIENIAEKQFRDDCRKELKNWSLEVLVQVTNSSIKKGDLTPFELIKQQELTGSKSKCNAIEIRGGLTSEQNKSSNQKVIFDVQDVEDESYTESSDVSDNSEISEELDESTQKINKQNKNNIKKRNTLTIRMRKDDGDNNYFDERIRQYKAETNSEDLHDYHELKDGFHISRSVWDLCYKILADEMGLGKTMQICVFLRSLAESQRPSSIFGWKGLGPSLVICPATVLHQWVNEFNRWFPLCRVAVLHSSGAHSGTKNSLIRKMSEFRSDGSVLVTSYSTYMLDYKKILAAKWNYVILDEGHKIRNPEAKITLTLKELRTPHRLILSGSPLQNNLRELWSLFDFIYPGLLGSLKEFVEKFSIPITQGGYANATSIQVRTAYKCACILRDAISPYLLRRMKKDVQMEYITSKPCQDLINGQNMAFAALMHLRKLCNHPDLVTGGPNKYGNLENDKNPELEYGSYQRSGKMIVVKTLLRLWSQQQQKVLLFSQSRQMLTILEGFMSRENYKYLRMDGTTPIGKRQDLVNQFNTDKDIFTFLLTTKVGGLGINLTGANRVLIYDPDWNPSTDAQARERAWRIGQQRAVTVYRLLTSGTIEEKIYQRQIFKHFLANRVLVNPKQQRFFKTNDLHELVRYIKFLFFTLGSSKSDRKYGTETEAVFNSVSSSASGATSKQSVKDSKSSKNSAINSTTDAKVIEASSSSKEGELDEETREKIRLLAKKYARNFGNGKREIQKKKLSDLFDGQIIVPMLKKQEVVSKLKAEENENFCSKEQDDYVLGKLLRKSKCGVNSTLMHDEIIQTSSTVDIQLIEDEANAVAKRAANVLKRSRTMHSAFLENISEFGIAPKSKKSLFGQKRAPEYSDINYVSNGDTDCEHHNQQAEDDGHDNPFGGASILDECKEVSGADLLRSIRLRKEKQLDINEDCDEEDDESNEYPSFPKTQTQSTFDDKNEKLAAELRNFLAVNNGRASTNEILSRFKKRIHPSDSFVFRSILMNIFMAKFRLRVRGSKAFKPSNGSSSSNSKVTKHRSVAKSKRLIDISSLGSMNDGFKTNEDDDDKAFDEHLPIHQMSLKENVRQKSEENTLRSTEHSKMPSESLNHARFSKHDQLLWKMLPSSILFLCSRDYRTILPMFVPVLGAALNEPDYCCISLASIRAALQIDKENDLKIMEKYAKNFFPILFSIYTNGVEDLFAENKPITKVDPSAVHQSTLATIRLYMHTIPKSLLKQYIALASTKLNDQEIISEQKILLVDILTAMCIAADVDDLQTIFNSITPWFDSHERPQKKAYRLLAQIYHRINEDDLKSFFANNKPFLKEIISSGYEKIQVLSSINLFDKLVEFCDLIYNEILDHLNNVNSKSTRQQSANCLTEMIEKLLRLWSTEENSYKPSPLDTYFCRLFVTVKKRSKDNVNKLCCALIALNILTRKHMRNLSSAALVTQLIGCVSEILDSVKEASVRLLAIRLMRTACSKMQPFMFNQFK
uniref:DNA repair and recombination protein RAD54-like n=1 Tax=Meloidogyne javanica TaxID=6303 RepID=A0A915LGS6_MELJA